MVLSFFIDLVRALIPPHQLQSKDVGHDKCVAGKNEAFRVDTAS